MNKDQLQKELKEKIKAGIKPSDIKKGTKKPVQKDILPPSIVYNKDEGYESDKSIPEAPPLPISQISALQKKIEIQEAIKKADEKKKEQLQKKIKELEK